MTGGTAPLADRLVAFVVERLERLERSHLTDLRVPGVFGGHLVAPDVRADLAFTLHHLARSGVAAVAGIDVDEAILRVLTPIDGPGTHTFFSYRVAEVLQRLGGLDAVPEADRANLEAACDSTGHLPLLADGHLPANYAAVLLRCEVGRSALGLDVDQAVLDDLVARTVAMLDRPGGFLDDSTVDGGRYDIYTADTYLFTEGLAPLLGEVWERGARSALDLVAKVGATNGAAIHWGRSTGALAACLTVELAGLAATHGLGADAAVWLARGANALDHLDGWFSPDGLITAHQHRSTFSYRGPFRRLQMTLDCLGKLADTAAALGVGRARSVDADLEIAFPPIDELVPFDTDRNAAVWTYRSRDLAFVLPVVGSTVNDYLPAPHNPGLFEVPVESDQPVGVPIAFSAGKKHTSGGLPTSMQKVPHGLTLRYDGFPLSRSFDVTDSTPRLGGSREVSYRVDGRTLHVRDVLHFDEAPQALAVQVTETAGRPLLVDWRCSVPHAATSIDVSGLKEHRSFWSELVRVHQVDVEPATDLTVEWSVTPAIRVLSSAASHHYATTVLGPLVADGRVVVKQAHLARHLHDGSLAGWDVFHLHWPEWSFGPVDPAWHRAAAASLRDQGVRILWTQHNLEAHDKDPGSHEAYSVWAAAADGVVHHSEHGRRLAVERYDFRSDAVHAVIPHPHFGHFYGADVERDDDGLLRFGIVGAPRAEKDVQLVLDAFAATTRDDLRLTVWSLGPDDVLPDDPRISGVRYEQVDWSVYGERLHDLDALVLPFTGTGMLTTGTVGDVVGAGLAAITSTAWPYLAEVLGAAALPFGTTRDDLTALLERLDRETLNRAAAAARALRGPWSSESVAEQHLTLLEQVGTTRL